CESRGKCRRNVATRATSSSREENSSREESSSREKSTSRAKSTRRAVRSRATTSHRGIRRREGLRSPASARVDVPNRRREDRVRDGTRECCVSPGLARGRAPGRRSVSRKVRSEFPSSRERRESRRRDARLSPQIQRFGTK